MKYGLLIVALLTICLVFFQEDGNAQYTSCGGSYSAAPRMGLFQRIAYRRGRRIEARRARLRRSGYRRVSYSGNPPSTRYATCSGPSRQSYAPPTPVPSQQVIYSTPSVQQIPPQTPQSQAPVRYYQNCSNGVCTLVPVN